MSCDILSLEIFKRVFSVKLQNISPNNALLLTRLEPINVLGTYKITGAEGGRQAKVLYPLRITQYVGG